MFMAQSLGQEDRIVKNAELSPHGGCQGLAVAGFAPLGGAPGWPSGRFEPGLAAGGERGYRKADERSEKGYKDTLSLPETSFPMRGDLVKKEPGRLAKWEEEGVYERIIARRRAENAPKFILHDGPPFANGNVHMGTALNKVLKDWW